MAQWTQTLEPYIRVHEEVKTMAINPTAGEDLIVGVTFISDAGPSTPTLIRSQKEFLETYTSQDLSQEYIESLNQLYTGDDKTLASTMWANAYRLAGSTSILAVRASKADGLYYTKPFGSSSTDQYIIKDGQLLKKVQSFKLVIDKNGLMNDSSQSSQDGWIISVRGVGTFGNRVTDEGVQYDFFANTLPELVDQLNDTVSFFSPTYSFYSVAEQTIGTKLEGSDADQANAVVFEEVYLGQNFLDTNDPRTFIHNPKDNDYNYGLRYLITVEPDWTQSNGYQVTVNLNRPDYSDFESYPYYATNVYNSSTPLKVRIRRFNHDAVKGKELTSAEKATLYHNGPSPYIVLTDVLNTYTSGGELEPTQDKLDKDFYEIAVFDPSINGETSFFNVGKVLGRGDMEVSEVNSYLQMIQLTLPDNLRDLGLNYYGYDYNSNNPAATNDDMIWAPTTQPNTSRWSDHTYVEETDSEHVAAVIAGGIDELYKFNATEHGLTPHESLVKVVDLDGTTESYYEYTGTNTYSTYQQLAEIWSSLVDTIEGKIATVETDEPGSLPHQYIWTINGTNSLFVDLTIDPEKTDLLSVSDSDFKKAMDKILEDEVYVTEGLSDLGNTELSFQSYLANMAISETGNYFYPISTVNSTNYMTIGNSATKISQDSYKLYLSAPWDIDTGTLGWKFYASPSVIYWEAVSRNRRNNNEFASLLGQSYGLVQYQRPTTEFNKKTRQLLLSRKVNTAYWNISTQAWNMNDCYTKENENNIMNEDGNSRLMLRISKAMPVILRQFIGRKITEPMCKEVVDVIDYWFRTTIIPMNISVDGYQIFCDYDEALARQNKIKVVVNCRYQRSLKYIEVYNRAFDVGMDISNPN